MKVVHVESGLGNQMLDYAEYLAIKESNPNEDCYLETIIYEIEECHNTISMWNGYELKRVFNINEPNIRSIFKNEQWQRIISDVISSEFWLDNWTYSQAITNAFQKEGLVLKNVNPRLNNEKKNNLFRKNIETLRIKIVNTSFGYHMKKNLFEIFKRRIENSESSVEKLFLTNNENLYGGHLLKFIKKGNQIERIESKLRQAFIFPDITDTKNIDYRELIRKTNSISIHARRGDMLSINGKYYKYGYFKRAVKYIKENVENPVFFIFSDQNSVNWCKKNFDIFNLNSDIDKIYFIDWNKGENSFRDMQLMIECKHNVITNSSFGWWASYLNTNQNKITCSPDIRINTTHSF